MPGRRGGTGRYGGAGRGGGAARWWAGAVASGVGGAVREREKRRMKKKVGRRGLKQLIFVSQGSTVENKSLFSMVV